VDEGAALKIRAKVTDDRAIKQVLLHYRASNQSAFRWVQMVAEANVDRVASIPQEAVKAPGVEYYIEAVDDLDNHALSPAGAPQELHMIQVKKPAPPPERPLDLSGIGVAAAGVLVGLVAVVIALRRRRGGARRRGARAGTAPLASPATFGPMAPTAPVPTPGTAPAPVVPITPPGPPESAPTVQEMVTFHEPEEFVLATTTPDEPESDPSGDTRVCALCSQETTGASCIVCGEPVQPDE
jgi:hypothetical protein